MMAKKGKKVVRSVFSRELYDVLQEIAEKLGLSESDLIRIAFMDYAQKLNKITEKLKD
jgi:DNA-directed RNA polymerase specialized sigma subunit